MRVTWKPVSVVLFLSAFTLSGHAAFADDDATVPKAAAPTGQKITLKLNLPKGSMRNAAMDMEMIMNLTINDAQTKVNMGMGMEFGFHIHDVDAQGNHTVKLTYNRVKMKMDGGPVSIDFDSAQEQNDDNPFAKIFGALVGQSLTMKMTPQGKVTEMKGVEEMAKQLAKAIPGASEEQLKNQLRETENQVGQMVATFPDTPLDNGDSWKATMKQGGATPMTIDATYTLLDRKDGQAIVGVDGKLSGSMEGTMSGTMFVDLATGWTNTANMKMKASGKPNGIPMDMDTTITMKTKM